MELEQRFRAINRAIKKGEKNGRYIAQQVSAHAQIVSDLKVRVIGVKAGRR